MRCTRQERSRSRGGPYEPPVGPFELESPAGSQGQCTLATSAVPGNESSGAVVPEVLVLYASPLDQQLQQINIQSELEVLSTATQQAPGAGVRLRAGIATTRALAQLLTRARAGGRQTVLHLSAHVATHERKGAGLVLETANGSAHVLYRADLEGLLGVGQRLEGLPGGGQRLEGLPLVFLNSCSSESIAQLFVESGCRHVIATRATVLDAAARAFTQQFYFALCSQQSVLTSWESARELLRIDPNPKIQASADTFVLFGQHNARLTTLWGLSGEVPGMLPPRSCSHSSDLSSAVEDVSSDALCLENPTGPSPLEACKLPPRVEDFVGRSGTLCQVLQNFDSSRRVCVISGPEGIGKTAIAIELAHFAAGPGRLFSRSVLFVSLRSASEDVEASITACLRPAAPDLLEQPGEPGSCQASRLLPALQRLERQRASSAGRRLLLVLDDGAGLLQSSAEVRRLLSSLLEGTQGLCIAAFSREQVYESLGSFKCVNIRVPPLPERESALLFLKRMHRPLQPCDLERGARSQGAVDPRSSEALMLRLASHPLLQHLHGNPGRLRSMSQRVTPELPSLFDLLPQLPPPAAAMPPPGGLQRMMSVDEESGRAEEGGGEHLTRKMSVDEGGSQAGGLPRQMSVDRQ